MSVVYGPQPYFPQPNQGSVLGTVVSARAPRPTDDTTKGYSAGAFWVSPQGTWQALAVNANKAIWLSMQNTATVLPCDITAGAVAAYGTHKLRNAYTGPALQLTRASDSATLNISFLNGLLDTAGLDAFLANTTGAVTVWYDQTGNNNHATGVAATAPHMASFNMIGNSRALVFDNQYNGSTFTPSCFLTVPSGVAATATANSAVCMTRTRNMHPSQTQHMLQWTGSTNSLVLGRTPFTSYKVGLFVSTSLHQYTPSFAPLQSTPYVAGFAISGSTTIVWKDDQVANSGYPDGMSNGLAGGFIGSGPVLDNNNGMCEMGAVIFYNAALSDNNRQLLTASLHQAFATVPQARNNWIIDGDSIAAGYNSIGGNAYSRLAEPLLTYPIAMTNMGWYGQTLSSCQSNYSNTAAPYFVTGANNILSIAAGSNDFINNATAATVETSLSNYCSGAKATGFKVLVGTILPRNDASGAQDTARQAYNTWVRGNWQTIADGIMDFDGNSNIGGAQSQSTNTTYYNADAIHPNATGHGVMANIAAAAVNTLL